jgi:hypothetical protein
MRTAPLALITLTAAVCGCDTVTSRYDTLAQAQADGVFGRGWLPDVLPPSSHDIRVSNDLDLNTSEGVFFFAPKEFAVLQARLTPWSKSAHPFTSSFDSEIERHTAAGYPASEYSDDDSTWVFLCKPDRGECTYTMWLRRANEQ